MNMTSTLLSLEFQGLLDAFLTVFGPVPLAFLLKGPIVSISPTLNVWNLNDCAALIILGKFLYKLKSYCLLYRR